MRRKLKAKEPMPRRRCGGEDHDAVGELPHKLPFAAAISPRIAKQFQTAAPGLVPLRVHEDNQVKPAVQASGRVIVEIYVRVQLLSAKILVRATTYVFGIVDQSGNVGDTAHHGQKIAVLHQTVETTVRRTKRSQVGGNGFAPGFTVLVISMCGFETWKLRH